MESVDYTSVSQVTNTNKQTKGKTMSKANRTTLDLAHHQDFQYENLSDMKRIAFKRAMEYIQKVYEVNEELQQHFDSYDFIWCNANRSSHWCTRNRITKKTVPVKIKISLKDSPWYTYNRKSIGKVSNGIRLPKLLSTTLAIIHEYTHAIQLFRYIENNCKGQRAGEVETTLNELHYVETVSPTTMNQLETI